jgi:capsular polysaccharide transport system permease protein
LKIKQQSSWQIQKSVVFALFIRELSSRFGRFKLGYVWAVAEPFFTILAFCLIRMAMGSGSIEGLAFPIFFASGMLIYTVFSNIGQAMIGLVENNLSLMNYQRIKPMDPLIARTLLEIIISAASIALILGGFYWAGYAFTWNSTLGFIAVFSLISAFSFGIGCIFAVVSLLFQEFKKIAPIILRPLFFISGIFFSTNSIPEYLLPYLLWNPILHAVELGRNVMFVEYNCAHASWSYLSFSTLASLALGLALFHYYQRKLVTSGAVKLV